MLEAEAVADAQAMKVPEPDQRHICCLFSMYLICAQGDAEAFAITARASAEAEGMNMKAEAFREYKKAAKVKNFEFDPNRNPQLLIIQN